MGFIFRGAGKEKPGWLLHLEEESLEISTILCAGMSLEVDQNCLEGKRWASPKLGLPLLPFDTPETPLLFQGSVKKTLLSVQPERGNALCVFCLGVFCLLVLKRLKRWDYSSGYLTWMSKSTGRGPAVFGLLSREGLENFDLITL